jgi:hypothetical protein
MHFKYEQAQETWFKVYRVKPDTNVRINRGYDDHESGCGVLFSPRLMGDCIGEVGYNITTHVTSVQLTTLHGMWRWPFFCLEVVK